MVLLAMLFRRCPTWWKLTLKYTTLFRSCLRCSIQRWNTQRCFNVVERCKFQRWRTQCFFNIDLTLCDVATSYQPTNNVELMLKCLLGCAKVSLINKKETLAQLFFCELCKISKNTFLHKTPLVSASEKTKKIDWGHRLLGKALGTCTCAPQSCMVDRVVAVAART